MALTISHPFIAIEGNIGAGKTTLSRMLAQDLKAKLILEAFADNPFLPLFYDHPERYAFTVELFFMTERHKQLQAELSQKDLFQERVIADYYFYKTLLFARNNLTEAEYRLFQRLFKVLNANFPKPDVLVYLHRPVDQLMANIKKRGRSFETDIKADYLQTIQQAYLDFFRIQPNLPILILQLEDADFQSDPQHYQAIKELIAQTYPTGVHYLSL
ncbi:MAG TPA: deoxynucleoside kinase [Saprospiraceae bacterium]|nr:deoxynucleoside kinase [Saprospiraceae bacterium]